ncbi:glycosyltransferase WbuB [Ferriphaselus sp. R-1]|uniref:glycosyltransferase WbuB n=1 Tax=Ferriphaselus sp. R-1 TaxID=1485544 RepID=UPI00054DC42A|nr:glycosyltransferase WbuB [Ferriphaselus sp. R-1]
MRILIHGINYAPELTGIGKYTGEMAEWLAAQGHDVRVVTAPPYYPQWKIADGYSNWWGSEEQGIRGKGQDKFEFSDLQRAPVVVYRCPLWVPARPSGVKRLIHLASFALSSLPVMLRQAFWKPDVVWVAEPALMCAPATALVARLCGAKAWLHVQDFEVDAAFDMGILPFGKLRDVVLWVERWLMRRFDRVSTISVNMSSRLVMKGVDAEYAVLFPNWVDTNHVLPLVGRNPLRSELGIAPERLVALYSGNMGEKQGLEIVLEVAQRMQERATDDGPDGVPSDVLFVMCGDGAARQQLMESYVGLRNVMWLPLKPMEKLNELLNMADIHLLPQRADVADLVMPSKLTGMLASGRAVIATAFPDTQVAQVVGQCGLVSSPGDVDGLLRAINKLASDTSLRVTLGCRAREYALAHLSKEAVLADFERELCAVTSLQLG